MFKEDLDFAELGEEKCWLGLLKSEKTKQVVDVRHDKYFQKYDVDFLQVNYKGQTVKVEVKTDRQAHDTGNIVYEISSNGNTGCLERSISDYIYYYLSETGKAYFITTRGLRDYIQSKSLNQVSMGDGAVGYLISISDLVRLNIAAEVAG